MSAQTVPDPAVTDATPAGSGATNLDLFVPGRPAPQGSKTFKGVSSGGRVKLVESSRATAPWRTLVAWHAAQRFDGPPLAGPLLVRLRFTMPRPCGTPKRSTPPATKRPDLDKLTRAVLDALSGVIWRDDSQVTDLFAVKRIAETDETPGVHIHVVPMERS